MCIPFEEYRLVHKGWKIGVIALFLFCFVALQDILSFSKRETGGGDTGLAIPRSHHTFDRSPSRSSR